MQFKQGVGVRVSDGKLMGKLDGVVIDPRSKEVNYIVVRKRGLFKSDKLVPLGLVVSAEDDGVTLREDAGDLEQLPDFEERYYVPADEAGSPAAAIETAARRGYTPAPSLYAYPPAISGEMAGLGNIDADKMIGALSQEPVVEQIERAIPSDNVVIRPGAQVISSDGKDVGAIEQVLTGENTDRATHFVIARGAFPRERKLIPVGWVSNMGEEDVHLAVDASFLAKLPAYNPPDA